jgi:hypothetical protein
VIALAAAASAFGGVTSYQSYPERTDISSPEPES